MKDEYIRRADMLNAVEKLDIIPSVDGMGIPTGAEDFRAQFLGTVLKVEPANVISKADITTLLEETEKELVKGTDEMSIARCFIISIMGIVKCKIMQMGGEEA